MHATLFEYSYSMCTRLDYSIGQDHFKCTADYEGTLLTSVMFRLHPLKGCTGLVIYFSDFSGLRAGIYFQDSRDLKIIKTN